MDSRSLGEILLEYTSITPQQLDEALVVQREKGFKLGEAVLQLRFLRPEDILKALSIQAGIPFTNEIKTDEIPSELISLVPINYAKKNEIIPLRKEEGNIVVAMTDPTNHAALDDLNLIFDQPIRPVIANSQQVLDAINVCYNRKAGSDQAVMSDLGDEENLDQMAQELEEVKDLLDASDEAPIIRLVNQLLFQGVKQKASDIHIEPFEKEIVVRYRIDGVLYDIMHPPKKAQNSILSRIKIMSNLNIAEKRLPQDGRIRIKLAGKDIDIRVSTLPTSFGESVVMRLLDRSKVLLTLDTLGILGEKLKIIRELVHSSHGIVLVTGPTGSGKTTTLYAALTEINAPDIKIITVEDPVEYQIPGINQTQVNAKIDMTFASSLRAILRQDPDVVMIGEIRDKETAEIAIQASLTGHLVLSTLHTNDSASSIARLIDMGMEPFLIASSLLGIVAQRLVRTLCKECAEPYEPDDVVLEQLGITREQLGGRLFYKAVGCHSCLETGYSGRCGVHEILVTNDEIRALIIKNVDAMTIKRAAMKSGLKTLRESGLDLVLEGKSSVDEVLSLTQEDIARDSIT
ncbi:MAG TPA: type II secretion system protein GspE [Holosporales bacterium]|nr:MAG: type II secretion system protein GspE [Deltaproteobacteria bacterium RIFCSPHIGHO2_02_FULL_40_28]OGQ19672.1 MAG: type II secretion system protein GspE [Deltaproteobacteria bacterium RIFCSPHIGHO2_12_FULL_40_32]OGQ40949.1 MAG: type II secretion system protein GspE [Deltaproteobacteria bacterium RIFCSPLOWO2_02_FULL_40_36]OGQ54064.1 MAG: type II secretion system protein GspE [Deltaproteobacteria bacterium RIFCSPLOWO2_12_FULL_40_28]HCC24191.1 type II secretion system protein GspE [Holosporale